jgi:hypothetical protein
LGYSLNLWFASTNWTPTSLPIKKPFIKYI